MSCILIWAALLLADPAQAVPELPDQVRRAVRQLDAPVLAERDAAEKRLLEWGPAVLPLLPTVSQSTPAEVALRVGRVQQQLLRAQATASAEATLVTLRGQHLPLSEVLQAFQQQTGNTMTDHRAAFGEQPDEVWVDVDLDKVPYWRALDQVLDQAQLTLYGFSGRREAAVVRRPPAALPRAERAVYSGIFRLAPIRFEAVRDLQQADNESLKLTVEVAWEPRLQPFAIRQPWSAIRALGDDGQPLPLAENESESEMLVREGTSHVELEVPLGLPPRSVKRLASFQGKFVAIVPGPKHDFRFQQLPVKAKNAPARRVEQRQAGATVTIEPLHKNNEVWEVGLRVKFDGPSTALESHRGWVLGNEAYFETSTGERIAPGGLEQTLQSADEIGMNYFFDFEEEPKNLTFVYRTPIIILELPVTYEFRDLPLP